MSFIANVSKLPDVERAQLALFLFESLDPAEEDGIVQAWRIEAEHALSTSKKARLVWCQ